MKGLRFNSLDQAYEHFMNNGIAIYSGPPQAIEENLYSLALKIGKIIKSFDGEAIRDIKFDPNGEPHLAGKTKEAMIPHTDASSYVEVPDAMMLGCAKAAADQGGESIVVSGEALINHLQRSVSAACMEALQSQDVIEIYENKEKTGKGRPIINGEQIYWHKGLPDIEDSRNVIIDYLTNPNNQIQFQLVDGEILILDNKRFLHGRSRFEDENRVMKRVLVKK